VSAFGQAKNKKGWCILGCLGGHFYWCLILLAIAVVLAQWSLFPAERLAELQLAAMDLWGLELVQRVSHRNSLLEA
jgi:hypothetical protein